MKISKPARRVLSCIKEGREWRASWDTVEFITSQRLAVYHGLDSDRSGWKLTSLGALLLDGKG